MPAWLLNLGAGVNRSVRLGDQLLSGQFGEARRTFTTADPDVISRTAAQTSARDAAARNPAFSGGGLRPGAAGFGLDFGMAQQTLTGEATQQFRNFAAGTAQEYTGGLAELITKMKEDAAAAGKKAADALYGLQVRALAGLGDSLDAEQQKLTLFHQRELGDAVQEYGKRSAVVAQLVKTQSGELTALQKKISESRADARILATQDTIGVRSDKTLGSKLSEVSSRSRESLEKTEAVAGAAVARTSERLQALANGLQSTLATGIEGLFTRGLSGIDAFWSNFKSTGIRVISELAASKLLGGLFTSAGSGGGSGSASRGILDTLSKGVSSLLGSARRTGTTAPPKTDGTRGIVETVRSGVSDIFRRGETLGTVPAPTPDVVLKSARTIADLTRPVLAKSTDALTRLASSAAQARAGASDAVTSVVKKLGAVLKAPTATQAVAMGSGTLGAASTAVDLARSSGQAGGTVDKFGRIGGSGVKAGGAASRLSQAAGPGLAIAGLGFGLGNVLARISAARKGPRRARSRARHPVRSSAASCRWSAPSSVALSAARLA